MTFTYQLLLLYMFAPLRSSSPRLLLLLLSSSPPLRRYLGFPGLVWEKGRTYPDIGATNATTANNFPLRNQVYGDQGPMYMIADDLVLGGPLMAGRAARRYAGVESVSQILPLLNRLTRRE
eukprot:COSAG02_NODE_4771_length_4995_cov_3.275735_4_plen_121_part_00